MQLRMHASCNLNRSRSRINTGTQLGKCESSKLVIPCRGSSHRGRGDRCYARVCAILQSRARWRTHFCVRAWARVAKGSRGVMVRKVGGNVNALYRFCMGDSTGEVST